MDSDRAQRPIVYWCPPALARTAHGYIVLCMWFVFRSRRGSESESLSETVFDRPAHRYSLARAFARMPQKEDEEEDGMLRRMEERGEPRPGTLCTDALSAPVPAQFTGVALV